MTGSVFSSSNRIEAIVPDVESSPLAPTLTSTSRSARRDRHPTLIGLGLVVALYIIGYGVLLSATHALPYVTDNNESFGAYFHGSSLVKYGIAESFGLTDEAFSPDAAAHPYVYTHGGNFPRAYTALLYALGARSVQAQIVIATFTVGLAGIVLLYAFFASIAGTLFASLASLVFASDYLFFTQWQVNSYRVWHTFLLFALLGCTLGWMARRPRLQFAAVLVCQLCLVYFDLTFAVFASVLVALFAAARSWRQPRSVVRFWLAQAAGGVLCVALLVVQSVAYMGWSAFAFDLAQTYGARNTALEGTPAGDQLLASLHSFYATNHVAFWRQLGGGGADRDVLSLFGQLVDWTLLPMTPLLSLIVLVVCGAWALSLLRARSTARPQLAARIAFSISTFGVALAVLWDSAVVGQTGDAQPVVALVLAALLGVAGARVARNIARERVWLASVLLVATAVLVRAQPALYASDLSALAQLSGWLPLWAAQLLVLLSVAFAAYLVFEPHPRGPGAPLLVYAACGLVAYVAVRTLLPGYVLSDYLERTAPIPVYVRDATVALVFTLLIDLGLRALASPRRPIVLAAGGLASAAAVFLGVYWAALQGQYVALIPPTHASFLQLLDQPPYQGASFVASQYAAPIAAQTGQWAYLDPVISSGQVKSTEDGFVVSRDDWYTWFADAATNPAYATPRYFLCFVPQNLKTAADHVARGVVAGSGCSGWQIVQRAAAAPADFPRDRLVASDPSSLDDWSIVQLDWDYPPFLRSIPDTSSDVQVLTSVDSTPDGFLVRPEFDARQQSGVPLEPPELRLYSDGPQKCVMLETTDPSALRLPPDFSGPVRVSVTPRTATTSGKEYLSKPLWVGLRLYTLPNVVTGQAQQIAANSLEEAKQKAQAAGTWTPTAGSLGEGFAPVPGPTPCPQR